MSDNESCKIKSKTNYLDKFLEYFINKYFVFKCNAELHESNTIDDIQILKQNISLDKITKSDNNMINLCKNIIKTFICYEITVDFTNQQPLSETQAETIYLNYKTYKSNDNSKRNTEIILDNTSCTKNTFYVFSFDNITTSDLQNKFGPLILTGNQNDKFRYEYRFKFKIGSKTSIFSLYDYKDDHGNFYKEQDIYWHVASDTSDPDIHKSFSTHFNKIIQECC